MLWPGECVRLQDNDLTFREQDVPEIVMPSFLVDDARATDAFLEVIAEMLKPALARSAKPLVEISGGFDSSCVAIAARSIGKDLYSYGLIHEGAVGVQQVNRRSELVRLIGASDFEFPSSVYTPFKALASEECVRTHMDDNHRLSCVSAVDAHPEGSFDLVLSGIGGDELTSEDTFKRAKWEVQGNIPSSSLVGSVGRADMFMRRGIWPSNPLAAQPVIDFCRALPPTMRKSRMLNVLTLARAGLSDGFIFPRYREHYGNAMQREASLIDFDAMLGESILADYGIFDASNLLQQARDASTDGFSYRLIGQLWCVMKLEAVLRRYIT
ncbi:MAG TPA: hypothetical protein VF552_14930 [Allosphingosinicella sp.]|jgi:hypothetical protein